MNHFKYFYSNGRQFYAIPIHGVADSNSDPSIIKVRGGYMAVPRRLFNTDQAVTLGIPSWLGFSGLGYARILTDPKPVKGALQADLPRGYLPYELLSRMRGVNIKGTAQRLAGIRKLQTVGTSMVHIQFTEAGNLTLPVSPGIIIWPSA